MRDEEDGRPKPVAGPMSAEALQMLGIEELEQRITSLKEQIDACEALIDAKRKQRSLADSVFAKRED